MRKTVVLYFFMFCFLPVTAFGRPQEFVREYTYMASEYDSKVSARDNAVEQMRAILLREIGEVVIAEQRMESVSRSNQFIYDNYSEKITAIAASMVRMEILNETWSGIQYYVRARIVIDPSEVSKRANEILLNQKEMKILQDKNQEVLQQVERLNGQLSVLRTQMRKNETFLFGEINQHKIKEGEYLSRIARLTEANEIRRIGMEKYKSLLEEKDSVIETLNALVSQFKGELQAAQSKLSQFKKDEEGQFIRISTQPAGALIYANNKYIGKTPFSYNSPEYGHISIKVKLSGYEQHTWNINYNGDKRVLTKTLEKSAL